MTNSECPMCKEITLHLDESTKDNFIHEFVCDSCPHFECRENPDYDPTPEEQLNYTPVHLRRQAE